ncbi:MAG: hypothetical protein DI543_08710 [Bradyrhizobium icense]|nr:MAG: hypothetical protein DI543_08710 [Bradyrhizobium icense]
MARTPPGFFGRRSYQWPKVAPVRSMTARAWLADGFIAVRQPIAHATGEDRAERTMPGFLTRTRRPVQLVRAGCGC